MRTKRIDSMGNLRTEPVVSVGDHGTVTDEQEWDKWAAALSMEHDAVKLVESLI